MKKTILLVAISLFMMFSTKFVFAWETEFVGYIKLLNTANSYGNPGGVLFGKELFFVYPELTGAERFTGFPSCNTTGRFVIDSSNKSTIALLMSAYLTQIKIYIGAHDNCVVLGGDFNCQEIHEVSTR